MLLRSRGAGEQGKSISLSVFFRTVLQGADSGEPLEPDQRELNNLRQLAVVLKPSMVKRQPLLDAIWLRTLQIGSDARSANSGWAP